MRHRRALSLVQWLLLAAVVVAVGLAAFAAYRFSQPAVTVTDVVEGPAVQAFYATGTLEPADREHPIRAPVEGFIHAPDDDPAIPSSRPDATSPKRLPWQKGSRVRRGQLIAVIYNESLQYAYDQAQADVVEKRARAEPQSSPVLQELTAKIAAYSDLVQVATREYQRYSRAIESGAANQADFDHSLDRLKTVESDLAAFKAQFQQNKLKLDRELAESESKLKVATWNLDQSKIKSPVDGFVLDEPQQLGSKVAINDLIVTVANTSVGNLVMRAQVDEEDVTKVRLPDRSGVPSGVRPEAATEPGTEPAPSPEPSTTPARTTPSATTQPAEKPQVVRMSLYAFADRSFVGHVVRIYPKADPERRTFEVDVVIEEPSPLMQAGMTGELAFEVESKASTLVVPSQALQDGKFWTVQAGRLQPADTKIGLSGVERVEVIGGLSAGTPIVISPIAGLKPGQAVRIGKRMDPVEAAGLNKPKQKEIFRGGF